MRTVVETPTFLRQADRQGMTEREREDLVNFVAGNPEAGDLIRHSGGCRKVRFGGKGKGKSGGFRVITFCSGESVPVFLLTVYAKGTLSNLSDAQVNILNVFTRTLVKEYRK
jgi:hypothetical protein